MCRHRLSNSAVAGYSSLSVAVPARGGVEPRHLSLFAVIGSPALLMA